MDNAQESAHLACGRCQLVTAHSLLHSEESNVEYRDADGIVDYEGGTYSLFRCDGCGQVALFLWSPFHSPGSEFGERVYPTAERKFFAADVPAVVREAYEEAVRVKDHSIIAYVVMVRRALEIIARDQGISESNLARSLAVLGNRQGVPKFISEAATLVRKFGNLAAHSEAAELDYMCVLMLSNFLEFTIDVLYTYPAVLREYKEILNIA